MAYRDSEGNIISGKTKKKQEVLKKKKSRKGEIVWAVVDLKLVVWKIEKEFKNSSLVKTISWKEIEIDNRKLRPWNDDDYFE